MLGNQKVQAFILTTDAARSRAFYEDTLGLRYVGEDDFAITMDSNGVELRLTKMRSHTPVPHTVLGWCVEDVPAVAAKLRETGIRFEQYGIPGQDETGIWNMDGSTVKVGWFKDPDGNVLSIAQH